MREQGFENFLLLLSFNTREKKKKKTMNKIITASQGYLPRASVDISADLLICLLETLEHYYPYCIFIKRGLHQKQPRFSMGQQNNN